MKLCSALTILALTIIQTQSWAQVAENKEKPAITIIATGGTIAGSGASNTDTTQYKIGTLGIDVLIAAVPELTDIARISGRQLVNIDSSNFDNATLLTLGKSIAQLVDEKTTAGIVVTHGTDTLEESAFFLELTTNSAKPVVLVGAMRPSTAISADGPMNLLTAVSLAADPAARNRGVLIALNDRIGSGFYLSKTNTTQLDTFKATEQGYLGAFIDGKARFYYEPAQPINKPYFDLSDIKQLPRVDILYGHQDQDAQLLEAAINSGAKGIILAGMGNGSIPDRMKNAVKTAIANGIPVVIASRTGNGFVTSNDFAAGSGFYSPQKSRILLMLAITQGLIQTKELKKLFGSETD